MAHRLSIFVLLASLSLAFALSLKPEQHSTACVQKKTNKLDPTSTRKPWRFTPRKKSRFDVSHKKSFRFELKLPVKNSTSNDTDSPHIPLHKKSKESLSHVLGKGVLWAIFLETYGKRQDQIMFVETPIPHEERFIPDVVAFDVPYSLQDDSDIIPPISHLPTFWGESGRMSPEKAAILASKYPNTHIVHFRWGSRLSVDIFEEIEEAVLPSIHCRTAPFEFALLAQDTTEFIEEDGTIRIQKEDLQWREARFNIDLNY